MPDTIDGRAANGALFVLRRAARADARALAELRAVSLAEQDHLETPQHDAFVRDAERAFARLADDGKLAAWLLCDGAAVLGSACAVYFDRLPYADGSLHAEVSGVYVRPAYRGRGFASRLLRHVMDDVRASGARKTFLRPASKARALYARLGFVDDTTGVMSLTTRGDEA